MHMGADRHPVWTVELPPPPPPELQLTPELDERVAGGFCSCITLLLELVAEEEEEEEERDN